LKATGASVPPFAGAKGFVSNSGGAALILESREAAIARGATIYATVEHGTSQSGDREELPRTITRVLAGAASRVLSSANATWIDRAESVALRTANAQAAIDSCYGATGEVYSATALLAIVATLLKRETSYFTSLCSDWSGCASTVTCRALANSDASL
jgi:3-oxoacyl-(acyl-carrier-protein) synthase